jgi:hypothetical protein
MRGWLTLEHSRYRSAESLRPCIERSSQLLREPVRQAVAKVQTGCTPTSTEAAECSTREPQLLFIEWNDSDALFEKELVQLLRARLAA